MTKLILVLFAFFSLVVPNLAIPEPETRDHTIFTGMGKILSIANDTTSDNCGVTNKENLPTVALSYALYDGGIHCGKTVEIFHKKKQVKALITESCLICARADLELSHAIFRQFRPKGTEGDIHIKWFFS